MNKQQQGINKCIQGSGIWSGEGYATGKGPVLAGAGPGAGPGGAAVMEPAAPAGGPSPGAKRQEASVAGSSNGRYLSPQSSARAADSNSQLDVSPLRGVRRADKAVTVTTLPAGAGGRRSVTRSF